MLITTQLPLSAVLTVQAEPCGRAGIHFLNWRFIARKSADLSKFPGAFKGAGIYALCFNDASIYVGSYLGEGTKGAYLEGNVVTSRLWTHVGAITMRGHRVHIARRSLSSLVKQFSMAHPMVKSLVEGQQPELFEDNGNLAPLRRIRFAAEHWDSFSGDDPNAVLDRFSFCYVRFENYPAHLNALTLKQEITSAEKRLIQRFAPVCNTTHVPRGKPAVTTSADEICTEITAALQHIINSK